MDHCESLLNACRLGNLKDVEHYLLEGISPNIQNSEGNSPLQVASANDLTEIVSYLLKEGAFIDLPNNYGWTPLMHAVRHGHIATVSLLLKMKAKVNICNKLGLRPVDLAAWNGQLSCMKLLIEAGAVIDNISFSNLSNGCEFSPVMIASLRGHEAVLRILLEKGASVNQVSSVTGLSPLMLAACNGHNQIVQIVAEWGGDTNKVDVCFRTALDLAIACNQREVKEYLEELTAEKHENASNIQNADILQAVRNGDISEVENILQQDSNAANAFDTGDGITPLMLASMLGYDNIVNILISNGASVNDQDIANGWTALMYAVFYKQASIANILIENGAQVDICASNGYTAVDLARHLDTSDTDILKILTDAMPDNSLLLTNYSPSISDASKRKLSSVEKYSARSQSQTRLKDWIGDVAQHLQQKVFVRSTSKHSSANLSGIDLEDFNESLNDVFLEKDSPSEVIEGPALCLSTLLCPDKHLSDALKEHTIEAVPPPLLAGQNYMDFMKNCVPNKISKDKMTKQPPRSLRVPRLIKNRLNLCRGSKIKEQHMTSEQPEWLEVTMKSSEKLDEPSKVLEPERRSLTSDEVEGDLTALLNKESLKEYVQKFREQEIDFETFQSLTDEDLNEIGIPDESRKKLLELIKNSQKT